MQSSHYLGYLSPNQHKLWIRSSLPGCVALLPYQSITAVNLHSPRPQLFRSCSFHLSTVRIFERIHAWNWSTSGTATALGSLLPTKKRLRLQPCRNLSRLGSCHSILHCKRDNSGNGICTSDEYAKRRNMSGQERLPTVHFIVFFLEHI